jgi:F420-non-reducing hydrogenase iron-sulfur subunit
MLDRDADCKCELTTGSPQTAKPAQLCTGSPHKTGGAILAETGGSGEAKEDSTAILAESAVTRDSKESAAALPESSKKWEPKIVAFLCNWCSYAGADLAGTGRIQYPPNVRVIRVPCSGRVDPLMILRCLQRGADGVLVSGCHPGDCHYIAGNYLARRKFALLSELLDFFGIEKGRVHFSWVSAAEGEKFADVVKQVTETVRALGKSNKLELSHSADVF